jgi:flagellar biosynthesis/type III secretory pathway M-ring protein FliF/YscJ
MPHIHLPTLLLVLGASALIVALGGMLLNERDAKKRAAARRERALKNARVLDARAHTAVRPEQGTPRKAPNPALAAPSAEAANGEGVGSDALKPTPKRASDIAEPLHSDSTVLSEAQHRAELMAEDDPERIVEIIREWMREDQ